MRSVAIRYQIIVSVETERSQLVFPAIYNPVLPRCLTAAFYTNELNCWVTGITASANDLL